jgi:zinc transport system ATP-binding protein
MTQTPDVMFHNVSFAYNGEPVLEKVYFKVECGDFLTVLGPNGGGKTTLLKLILGLIRPQKGKIEVFGRSPEKARISIGYVPQHLDFDPRFPLSVCDVILMGRLSGRPFGPYRREDREAACAALEQVDLLGLRRRGFGELSGGQRQRVLIARALTSSPRLLLLDEPTANIDRDSQRRLYELLGELNRHLTIFMATHDVGFVSKYVKSVLCVNRSVLKHPTSRLGGKLIRDLYGSEMALVQHGQREKEG